MGMWASVLGPVFVVIAVVLVGQLGFLRGSRPADLGARDGLLKAPSETRNSVTSQASRYPNARQRAYAEIAPLRYTGDAAAAITRLAGVVGGRRLTHGHARLSLRHLHHPLAALRR